MWRLSLHGPRVFDRPEGATTVPKISRYIAYCGALIALTSGLLPMLGWSLGEPVLQGMGFPALPATPPTAVGIMASALALLATIRGARPALVLPLVVLAAAIGTASLFEHVTGRSIGIDSLLVTDATPDRTGPLGSAAMVALAGAIALAGRRDLRAGRMAALIAGWGFALGVLLLLLVPNAQRIADPEFRLLAGTFPGAVAMTGLSVALLAWRAEAGWSGILADASYSSKLFRLLFPVVLMTPVFAEAIEFLLLSNGWMSPVLTQLVNVSVNGLVVAGLLFWATTGVMRQRDALQSLTRALDTVPVALTRADGRIFHWSRGCEELYGWTAAEAIGRCKHHLLHSRLAPECDAQPQAPPGEGDRGLLETRRGGETVHVLEHTHTFTNAGGESIRVVSMIDIGARVEAEAALRESQEQLALALQAHEVGICEWDIESGDLRWSPGSEQRLGFAEGALSRIERWRQVVEVDERAGMYRALAGANEERPERLGFKYHLREPSGALRAIEGSARCFYDEPGKLVRMVGVHMDVTPREEREAALQFREAQLRSILETVPDAMVVVDERGCIRSFSRTAEHLFGYSAQEAVGMNVALLSEGQDPQQYDRLLARFFGAGERPAVGKTRLLTAVNAQGTEMPVEVRVGEAFVGGERLLTGFIRDISERVAAEERLSVLTRDLMHVSRINAMGEMAATLAHELNQPLAAIVNYVATADVLVHQDTQPDAISEMLVRAKDQALSAGEIIRRLRTFGSKSDTEMRAEPVAAAIEEATSLVLVGQGQFNLRVSYELDSRAEFMFADRVQIQQVLVNLVRNSAEALRAVPRDEREIRLHSRLLDPATIEIGVRDTGPGIDDAVLARMYEPFTSTKQDGGMGIGLSICRRIVEVHGGELVAENLEGGGAYFHFTLPRIDPREVA